MSDWHPIQTAPRTGSRVLVCWEGRGPPWLPEIMIWKTNSRIVDARERGYDVGPQVDSYFGDPDESDDYELADPKNFPTHWLPIPPVPSK